MLILFLKKLAVLRKKSLEECKNLVVCESLGKLTEQLSRSKAMRSDILLYYEFKNLVSYVFFAHHIYVCLIQHQRFRTF